MPYIRFQFPRVHPSEKFQNPAILTKNMHDIATIMVEGQLNVWSLEQNIEYTLHTRNDALYVEFAREAHITQFYLTWKPIAYSTGWKRISVVEAVPPEEVAEPWSRVEHCDLQ